MPDVSCIDLRFGVVADIHHADFDIPNRQCSKSLQRLRNVLAWFEQSSIDLIINMGDSINGCDNRESEHVYARTIGSIFDSFPGETRYLIGNHDLELLTKAEYRAAVGMSEERVFECAGIRMIFLDGNCHPDGSDFSPGNWTWDQAYLGPQQIAWLERELRSAGDQPVILMCHECLDQFLYCGAPDPHIVRDIDSLRPVINAAPNVLAVLQGHYHHGRNMQIDGIPYVAFASLVAGEDPDPGAAAIVTVRKDGCVHIEGYGRQETITLCRE